MLKTISVILGIVTPLFLLVAPSFAATIKINEFSSADNPEWVELYSPESTEINLDGWSILFQDNPDTTQKIILGASDTIPAGGYKIIERTYTGTSAWLRNDGDVITLRDNTGAEDDSVKYGDVSGAQVSAPSSGQSAGRSSDGTGGWIIFSTSTKGSTNNTSTPTPSPTPAPTTTPTASPTPTPTPTPSPTPTSKPTTAASSASTPKPTTSSPTPGGVAKVTTTQTSAATPESMILGVTDVSSPSGGATTEGETTESAKETKKFLNLSARQYLAGFLAILGLAFLGTSGFLFFKGRNSAKIDKTENENS